MSRYEGHMSTQGYEEELRSERSYVAGLYTRLDAERARVKGRYSAALRGPSMSRMAGHSWIGMPRCVRWPKR